MGRTTEDASCRLGNRERGMGRMKVLLIKPMEHPQVVDIENSLKEFYRILDCDCITATYPWKERAVLVTDDKENTMTYTKINLYLANGIPEALSNLWYGSDSAVVEIRDAVEDAKNGKDLLNRIQKMKLLRKFTLDRENEKHIRFKGTDCWGNVSYLEIIR